MTEQKDNLIAGKTFSNKIWAKDVANTLRERDDYIHFEDYLVSRVEPIFIKYKDSLSKNKGLDFRNFASFEAVRIALSAIKQELKRVKPLGDEKIIKKVCCDCPDTVREDYECEECSQLLNKAAQEAHQNVIDQLNKLLGEE